VLLEKIHGCSARFCFRDGRLWCGSHHQIKREAPGNLFWRMAEKYGLRDKLARHPGLVLYAEVYGWVQDLRYGARKAGDYWLACFDAFEPQRGRYLDWDEAAAHFAGMDLPPVPELFRGPWSPELKAYAEGMSRVHAGTVREGFVVRPLRERFDDRVGRVILKLPGEAYLTRQ
jgi:hypothetical protein